MCACAWVANHNHTNWYYYTPKGIAGWCHLTSHSQWMATEWVSGVAVAGAIFDTLAEAKAWVEVCARMA